MGYPGFDGLGLAEISPDQLYSEPGGQHGRENQARARSGDPDMYFPDGNATITRLLVRALVPDAVPGKSMEDVVTSRVNYSMLDRDENKVRIRLNSPAVQVKNLADGRVQTSYVNSGDAYSVMSEGSVLACWNTVIPHLCEEIPQAQKEALAYGAKAPLVYTNVLLSNWRSMVEAKVSYVTAPGSFHQGLGLQASLAMGDYRTSRSPDDPIVLRMSAYFYSPGMSRLDQHRAGRSQLLNTSFDSFEYNIRDQLARIFGPTGFDDERDILGIIVNRWPHGYTYSYNALFEPDEWAFTSSADRPAVQGRQPVGRITIANADAAASPHTDAAINEAYRAVSELFA
jgi:spermidine dehydrogenase